MAFVAGSGLMRRRGNAFHLVHKVADRLSRNCRALNGRANLMTLVLEGHEFKDDALQQEKMP